VAVAVAASPHSMIVPSPLAANDDPCVVEACNFCTDDSNAACPGGKGPSNGFDCCWIADPIPIPIGMFMFIFILVLLLRLRRPDASPAPYIRDEERCGGPNFGEDNRKRKDSCPAPGLGVIVMGLRKGEGQKIGCGLDVPRPVPAPAPAPPMERRREILATGEPNDGR